MGVEEQRAIAEAAGIEVVGGSGKDIDQQKLYATHLKAYQSLLTSLANAGGITWEDAQLWYSQLSNKIEIAFSGGTTYSTFIDSIKAGTGFAGREGTGVSFDDIPFARYTYLFNAESADSSANLSFFTKDITQKIKTSLSEGKALAKEWDEWNATQEELAQIAEQQYQEDYVDYLATKKRVEEITLQRVENQRIPGWLAEEQNLEQMVQRPGLPSPTTEEYEKAIEGLSENERRFFDRRAGEVFAQFEEEQPDARSKWWGALNPEPEPVVDLTDAIGGLEYDLSEAEKAVVRARQLGIKYDRAGVDTTSRAPFVEVDPVLRDPASAYEEIIGSKAGGVDRIATELDRMRTEQRAAGRAALETGEASYDPPKAKVSTVDPFDQYVKDFPFSAEYMKQSAQKRGFRSYRFNPLTRFGR